MLFSGIPFIYYFAPAALGLYFAAPRRWRNGVLAAVSLVFYGYGEPMYLFLMAFAIGLGYGLGLLIDKYRGRPAGKGFFLLSVACSLGMLGYFKYADFFVENFNSLTGLGLPLLKVALPIGISFYTFQLLSYTIDLHRGNIPVQRSIVDLAAYITMFPQLIAGPIVRYADVMGQLVGRECTLEKAASGIRRFSAGLGKKVLLANALGELCQAFREAQSPDTLFCWLYAVCLIMQIYFDFSGYSDMAIGLGRVLGFEFMENFNYPYISKSATEFWRRWHMSLGQWFRDYVYIPMGGNRCSKPRWMLNIFVVWGLTGMWHGAEWNFIIWGLYYGVILMVEKLWLLKRLEKLGPLTYVYALLTAIVGFVIFDSPGLALAGERLMGLVGRGGPAKAGSLYLLRSYGFTMLIGAVCATPLPKLALGRLREWGPGRRAADALEPIVCWAVLLLCTAYLVDGSFNPFLYFRF